MDDNVREKISELSGKLSTREKMVEHIRHLCISNQIEWTYCPFDEAFADWRRMSIGELDFYTAYIQTPPIHHIGDYLLALHEIAHILDLPKKSHELTLDYEARCWRWALAESIVSVDAHGARRIYENLGSYEDAAVEHKSNLKLPEPKGVFYRLRDEMRDFLFTHERSMMDKGIERSLV